MISVRNGYIDVDGASGVDLDGMIKNWTMSRQMKVSCLRCLRSTNAGIMVST